ncbi:MAG TPA: toxin-antitoxin system HicB family antitoxin, partial [Pseudonocardia sp.]|nr:toxin-antitoxin system HicB family antitoxin [Pseudonocardia sp.]
MDLNQYVQRLREDLASAAAAGDEQTQRTAALLGGAIEPAARLALMNALSDLAAEVTAALGDRVVEVRLDGRDVRVSVSPDRAPEPEQPENQFGRPAFRGFGGVDAAGDISRITLR